MGIFVIDPRFLYFLTALVSFTVGAQLSAFFA
jgi:hypothetical protein